MARRAIVMDRDGTISEEVGFVDRPERLRLLPGSAEAVRLVNRAGFQAVVATNQSGVARGLFDEARLDEVHEHLRTLLAAEDGRLDGIYHCPHHPEADDPRYRRACGCRKPEPGLLLRARDEMGIDLGASYMIGDRLSDLEAGARAGAIPLLVLTGCGRAELGGAVDRPPHVADDLLAALRWILERETVAGAVPRP